MPKTSRGHPIPAVFTELTRAPRLRPRRLQHWCARFSARMTLRLYCATPRRPPPRTMHCWTQTSLTATSSSSQPVESRMRRCGLQRECTWLRVQPLATTRNMDPHDPCEVWKAFHGLGRCPARRLQDEVRASCQRHQSEATPASATRTVRRASPPRARLSLGTVARFRMRTANAAEARRARRVVAPLEASKPGQLPTCPQCCRPGHCRQARLPSTSASSPTASVPARRRFVTGFCGRQSCGPCRPCQMRVSARTATSDTCWRPLCYSWW